MGEENVAKFSTQGQFIMLSRYSMIKYLKTFKKIEKNNDTIVSMKKYRKALKKTQ